MATRRRPWLRLTARRSVFAAVLLGQLVAALGLPLPAVVAGKPSGQAYPCQDRPCGCVSAELCWQGDCCCFTLEEKCDWADAHGADVPAAARAKVAARKAPPPPPKKKCCACEEGPACCDEELADAPRWTLVVRSQSCRGDGPGDKATAEPAPPPAPSSLPPSRPSLVEALSLSHVSLISHAEAPTPPPPRAG